MIKKHTISFKNALHGIMWALRTQPNYKIHTSLSLLSLITGAVLRISYSEFTIIILFIFFGFTIETINTAIEKTADAITKEFNEDIKIAKDVSAGAMLIFAFGAFVSACIIFLPKLLAIVSI